MVISLSYFALLCMIPYTSHRQQGIEIKSPVQWPYNKGLSFCCWLRVENFPEKGMMGLFSFFTENGKGCLAMLGKNTLIYEVILPSSFVCFLSYFASAPFLLSSMIYLQSRCFFGKLNNL